MPDVLYSPTKQDLFFPARRGHFFESVPAGNDATECAEMCRLAHCRKEPSFSFDRDQVTAVLAMRGYTVQFFESKGTPNGMGTHCLLALNAARKLAITAFRGTDANDPTDIFEDGSVLQTRWAVGGMVHTGFAHALSHVQDELLQALNALDATMFYTGHSLGAAMATLLASLRRPDSLCTIGCPRVGNGEFVATLAGVKSSRFVDCCDIVTRVPPELDGTYEHLGPPLYIAEDRTVHADPGDAFIDSDRIRAAVDYTRKYTWVLGNVPVRELADHAAINYVAALAAS